MDFDGMKPNFFTINGKSFPATETLRATVGERVRLRFIGTGQFIHPMHLHGQPFEIVETDGSPVPPGARLVKDTVLVGPGERYDVEFVARAPGQWLIHCHIAHHTTNDGTEDEGAGGLTMVLVIAGIEGTGR
jgi:FtsP/CotA-like multicopper oxidase with cupredoxin domain